MRARLIVNPASGKDRAAGLLPRINERLRAVVRDLDITMTADEHDAERAAARAVADGCDAVYVAGGDGTLNAVLRGLLPDPDTPPGIPVGLIPLGTGNDFARSLGLGEEPEAALEILARLQIVHVDVGTVNGRPFVNTSAGGFVADVSEAVSDELKDVAGKAAYLIGGVRALLGAEPFAARVVLRDAEPDVLRGWTDSLELQMFAVCNGRFIGGGRTIAPAALVDDGLLDVLVVPTMPVLDFVAVLQRVGAGDPGDEHDVLHFRASAFDFEFSRTVRVNTDGEVLETDRCQYRLQRRAIPFFCGPSPAALADPTPLR